MLKIDNSLLEELGLGSLPDNEKNGLLRHIYETLEMRVGMRLADQMSNEQLDEFEQYFEAKDDAGAFKWLETNFPNYKEIVQQEFDKLKSEVGQSAQQIVAASGAQASAPQPGPYPPQPVAAAPGPAPVAPQPGYDQPMQAPNAPAPAPSPGSYGAPPQATPAPGQPYAPPPAQPGTESAAPNPPYPPQQPPAGPGFGPLPQQ
jgi:hypothetical protein